MPRHHYPFIPFGRLVMQRHHYPLIPCAPCSGKSSFDLVYILYILTVSTLLPFTLYTHELYILTVSTLLPFTLMPPRDFAIPAGAMKDKYFSRLWRS